MKLFSDRPDARRAPARAAPPNAPYTDLALERAPRPQATVRGSFSVTRTDRELDGVTYLTVRSPRLGEGSGRIRRHTEDVLAAAIAELVGDARRILVVGLGNRGMVCDALGPLVADGIVAGSEGPRTVCAFSPGVAGMTGMDTQATVRAVADAVSPELVVAVDALCARDSRNLGVCFQLSTGGIAAGSGVAAHNLPLSRETLGVPCIALGVPTVVRARTLLGELLDACVAARACTRAAADKVASACDTLAPLLVTPKTVDVSVTVCAGLLSAALNRAFARPLRT